MWVAIKSAPEPKKLWLICFISTKAVPSLQLAPCLWIRQHYWVLKASPKFGFIVSGYKRHYCKKVRWFTDVGWKKRPNFYVMPCNICIKHVKAYAGSQKHQSRTGTASVVKSHLWLCSCQTVSTWCSDTLTVLWCLKSNCAVQQKWKQKKQKTKQNRKHKKSQITVNTPGFISVSEGSCESVLIAVYRQRLR